MSAPRHFVDRLVLVADDAMFCCFCVIRLMRSNWRRVRVLVFVDEDVLKFVVVLLADFRNVAQEPYGLDQKII
jgi:hypothetical protein